jgi:uncharacterized alpha-E superfamily protein
MLSRVAEACFWLGRYLERAEDVSRIVDVNYHGVIENSWPQAEPAWWSVVATTGDAEAFRACYPQPTETNVADFLLLDRSNLNSVARCVMAARESARRIRDRISSETWEELNRFYHIVMRQSIGVVMMDGPYAFCRLVRNNCQLLAGVIDSTMPHDEGWLFLRAGRFIERTGMTARILDSQAALLMNPETGTDYAATHRWIAVLKSASAYEAQRKLSRSTITPEGVVTFLLADEAFPRSALFSMTELEVALTRIRGILGLTGHSQALRDTGELAARLRYTNVDAEFMSGLHNFLDNLELACNRIGEAVALEYFGGRVPLRRGA